MKHYLVDLPARAVLLPVLAAQAVQVRRKALRLPEAAGPRIGSEGNGPDLSLLILGDSSAAGVGADRQSQALSGQLVKRLAPHHRVQWRLEAVTGATTRDRLARLDALPDQPFDVAVVALGVNDVTRAVPLPVWMARQRRLARALFERFGVRRICLSGLPPMGEFPLLPHPLRWVLGRQAERFDAALKAFAATDPRVSVTSMVFDLDVAHMAEDGYHPGPTVYAAWAEMLAEEILAPRAR